MPPGALIKRVYLELNRIGSNALAQQLKVSTGMMSRLVNEKTGLSFAVALTLPVVLGRRKAGCRYRIITTCAGQGSD